MRPGESFVGQPIRSLQSMLRVIAEEDPSHMRLIPDGIYGPETVRAVSLFQRTRSARHRRYRSGYLGCGSGGI